jgi:NAD-dependent dihydropyrimidine dehydrogenase PreA subunit
MLINEDECSGCKLCFEHCPVGAIAMVEKKTKIDQDTCTECGNCKRANVCPEDAFEEIVHEWPRSIRAMFSNPYYEFEETRVTGRGTEEMKTNDVTGRFGPNDIGFSVDVGRPGVGTRLCELEKISKAVAKVGVIFEADNPVTSILIKNVKTGELAPEIRNENILSAVVEFMVTPDKVVEVVNTLKQVAQRINTVFSLGVIGRVNEDGSVPVQSLLESENIYVRPNGKTNLGLGKPLSP